MPHMERNNRTDKEKIKLPNFIRKRYQIAIEMRFNSIRFFYKIFLKVKFTLIIYINISIWRCNI